MLASRGQRLPLGGELHRGVEADVPWIDLVAVALYLGEIRVRQPCLDAHLPLDVGRAGRIGKILRPVHEEDGPAVDPHVAVIGQDGEQMLHVLAIVVGRVSLGEEHLMLLSGPLARPVLVGQREEKETEDGPSETPRRRDD
jgi:hypothetical protein